MARLRYIDLNNLSNGYSKTQAFEIKSKVTSLNPKLPLKIWQAMKILLIRDMVVD